MLVVGKLQMMLRLAILASAILVFANGSALSSFTSDSIAIHPPILNTGASLADEITGLLQKHWILRSINWADLRNQLLRLTSLYEKASYLSSLGDPYCRLIASEDMQYKSFQGTRIGTGLRFKRNYWQYCKNIFLKMGYRQSPANASVSSSRIMSSEYVHSNSIKYAASNICNVPPEMMTPSRSTFTALDKIRLAANIVIPVSFLGYSAIHKSFPSLQYRNKLFKVLYKAILLGNISYQIAKMYCPIEITSVYTSPAMSECSIPKEGDILVSVNNRKTNLLSTRGLEIMLEGGEKDEIIKLSVRRKGSHLIEDVFVSRADIPVENVKNVKILPSGVGYFSISEFNDKTYEEVVRAVDAIKKQLQQESNTALSSLVVDLRGNGGGLVSAAFDVASLFLPKGKILSRISLNSNAGTTVIRSTNSRPELGVALLLLVDGKTASASEILAAALRDNNRAATMGETTVGKNMAQAIVRLTDGSGLVFTVRTFTSPTQRFMGNGITPDIAIQPRNINLNKIKWHALERKWSL